MTNRLLSWSLLIVTFLFWALAAAQPVYNPDLWYHLKTGEYICQTKTIPKKDLFSHTAFGREWVAQWWLYDVIVYQVQSHLGFNGLVFLKIVNALLILIVLLITMRRFRVPLTLASLLLTWGMLIVANAWVDRPHLFSYLYIVILIDILIAYRLGNHSSLWIIPLLTLIWSNTHASIPLALVFLVFAIFSEMWLKLSRGATPLASLPKALIFTLILAFISSLINPNHLRTHLYVFKINPEFVANNIVEWIPLSAFFEDYHIKLFLVFGLLSLVSFFAATKKARFLHHSLRPTPFEILIYLALIYLAFSALRFAPVFVLILLPFTAKNILAVFSLVKRKWRLPRLIPKIQPVILSLTVILITMAIFEFKLEGSGLGVSFARYPAKALNFLLKEKPPPELYHPFNWGGFLIWAAYPHYRVFIDGRLDMYVPDVYQAWLDVIRGKDNWAEILDQFKVNTVLLPSTGEGIKLGNKIEQSNNWVLVYWDDQLGIFVKDIPENASWIEKFGLRAILVYDSTRPYREGMAKQASREFRRLIRTCPDCTSSLNKLGVLYLWENQPILAKKYFREAIRVDNSYSAAIYNYGYVIETEGRFDEAMALYRAAIKANPFFPDAYRNLGILLVQRLHYNEEALPSLEKYLELRPEAPDRTLIENVIRDIGLDKQT